MSARIINLNDKQIMFYLLNVIHDIIHDYGYLSSENRWINNAKNVKQFLPDRFTLIINDEGYGDGDGDEYLFGGAGEETSSVAPLNVPRLPNSSDDSFEKESVSVITPKKRTSSSIYESEYYESSSMTPKKLTRMDSPRSVTKSDDIISNMDDFTSKMPGLKQEVSIEKDTVEEHVYPEILKSFAKDLNIDIVTASKYCKNVQLYNEKFVEHLKIVPIFNFFEYITNKTDKETSILQNIINNTIDIDTYVFAHRIFIQDNNDNFDDGMTEDIDLEQFLLKNNINVTNNKPTNLDDVYSCLANKFGDYLYNKYGYNVKINTIRLFTLFNDISNFLDSSVAVHGLDMNGNETEHMINVVNACMIELLSPREEQNVKNDVIYGGVKTKLKPDEPITEDKYNELIKKKQDLVNYIYEEAYPSFVSIIDSVNIGDNYSEQMNADYQQLYDSFINKIVGINGEDNYIKDFNKLFEPRLPSKKTRNLMNNFKNKIDSSVDKILKPWIEQINDYVKIQNKKETEEKKAAKIKAEEEKRIRKEEKAKAKLESGEGLGELATVRTQYLKAVATLGLYLNGIDEIKRESLTTKTNLNMGDELLNIELDILTYYTTYDPNDSRATYKRDLDSLLMSVVKKYHNEGTWKGGRYICSDKSENNPYLYIIDNASSMLTEDRVNNTFCPLTSIIDGMLQCTIGAKGSYNASSIEYGNMDFMITNENEDKNQYYRGMLILSDGFSLSKKSNNVTYQINYRGANNDIEMLDIIIDNIEIKNGKIRNLEAKNVLNNMLVSLLSIFINNLKSNDNKLVNIGTYLTTNIKANSQFNIFQNIIDVIKNNEVQLATISESTIEVDKNTKSELLQSFFSILAKGAGDIFQEINAVCKYGGYTSTTNNYSINRDIIPWNNKGDAKRCFLANDRPSATRFIFLSSVGVGKANDINKLSFGGYVSDYITVLYQRTTGNVCDIKGGTRKHKRKYKHKKYSKKYNRSKPGKKSRCRSNKKSVINTRKNK